MLRRGGDADDNAIALYYATESNGVSKSVVAVGRGFSDRDHLILCAFPISSPVVDDFCE